MSREICVDLFNEIVKLRPAWAGSKREDGTWNQDDGEELVAMAKDLKAAAERDENLGLSMDEVAFYDALAERPEVLRQMGDETLKQLAMELNEKLRGST